MMINQPTLIACQCQHSIDAHTNAGCVLDFTCGCHRTPSDITRQLLADTDARWSALMRAVQGVGAERAQLGWRPHPGGPTRSIP